MVSRDWKTIIPITKENNGILPTAVSGERRDEYVIDYEDEDEDEQPPLPPPDNPDRMNDALAPDHVDPLPQPGTGTTPQNM